MTAARVSDIEMAYKEYNPRGEGIPLVMIMGYGCTMDLWPPSVIERLAASYRVIVFDNRGMGESSSSDGEFSIELFAEDARGLLDVLAIPSAHILGWSMGTFIAQELALRHPSRVDSLVLSGGHCGGSGMVRPGEEVWRMLFDISGTIPERIQRMFSMLFPAQWLDEHRVITDFFPPFTEPVLDESLLRQQKAIISWPGAFERLPLISQPLLAITGTEDAVIPAANSYVIGERVAGASVIQIKGGGHGVMYQAPVIFTDYLLAFLNSCRKQ